MINTFQRFINVPMENKANQRRSRLLNILLLGTFSLTILGLVIIIVITLIKPIQDVQLLIGATLVMLAGILLCLYVNHQGKVILASASFLILVTLIFSFADRPQEVVAGRTLFMFTIPILMASFLLRPYASFFMTLLIAVIHIWMATANQVPNYTPLGIVAFLFVALVAWLAALNLENALYNLQKINDELDQRVNERTRELAGANQQLRLQAEKLEVANERLTELDKLKSRFVSDVSHELRTPIANLSIYLEMMDGNDPVKNERYLNVLREETSRLGKLVSDVLNLSRMEMGSIKVNYRLTDLNDLVSKVVLANQLHAEAKGLEVIFTPYSDLPPVWADQDQMTQVINNLVANAINYTTRGKITVTTLLDAEKRLVRLKVQDTGMGIPESDLPHLFERFYRGQQAAQSTIPGTGLGLAITNEIILKHQGMIEVDSKLGAGSIFTVNLPVLETAPAPEG